MAVKMQEWHRAFEIGTHPPHDIGLAARRSVGLEFERVHAADKEMRMLAPEMLSCEPEHEKAPGPQGALQKGIVAARGPESLRQ